ncbi:MFS transporter [Vibrio natriegens]|uniref:MFS transporter n=1 Tax=Vibrio natriegens TaxID=691 RepID=UPI0021E90E28|nr:MFS transporter [Vibrio natriegens]UYI49425.1 MFS transporter [Vibrio natriegens]
MYDKYTQNILSIRVFAIVILIGLNLRPFLVAIGPSIEQIVEDTGLGYSVTSLLTLIPMALMGAGALIITRFPFLTEKINYLLLALLMLMIGNSLRLFAENGSVLLLSTFVCGGAVALIQSCVPRLIKQHFTKQMPVVVGCYSASLMVGGALGALVSQTLIGEGLSWRESMAWLALPCLLTLILAGVGLPRRNISPNGRTEWTQLFRQISTWELVLLFGLVNGGYASIVTWLPPYYQKLGFAPEQSSHLIFALSIIQACCALLLPMRIKQYGDRRVWLMAMLTSLILGLIGVMFWPQPLSYLWAALSGIGLGGGFSICMLLALERYQSLEHSNALSVIMQGGGFLLASLFPLVFILFVEFSGEFSSGWTMQVMSLFFATLLCLRLPKLRQHQPEPNH